MNEAERIEEEVCRAGFSCLLCGACCSGPDNEVMVSPPEIAVLAAATGLSRDEIAEPYPEWMQQDGCTFTFGWVLKRGSDGNCIFLEKNRCRVYRFRPHICRTYPFMLDKERLIVSACPGCVAGCETAGAGEITGDLLRRREAEDAELEKTENQYQKHSIITGSTIVFDSSGAHEYSLRPK
ncbi:YkgJ family cysteine cluster protein [Methanocorpusculum vombati]|uniref:YkgJ family cysteine cluster protein n=1 Tax=Methanocorpusculum vombati TaxID=3002864 RepID=A0ABT4IK45_9EURY|nr:YkgJ family cysteine cluster protein [Methanocorpusculum vombati]MCZ9318664.1 YkgJ family cysteine cluster protein [Methanocorpusculum sp.]MCZ0862118.1 YkgJ family cysteine cluster protein [Methanocorpusculum vombati]MDE2520514.1 YkgJ family cysteine cluster protein [Methanocorpusculum sp.]MDE2534036.1 YkgJ family cysteine cluster protein [Methanocorpusculum sp.]MDE2546028.1 YkgJ family cysteine cluster protein [Methanocorpusculum sp.]